MKRAISLILIFICIQTAVKAQLQSPGGPGSYILASDFDYTDFRNFPSKVIGQDPVENPNFPYASEYNLRQNFVGHYAPIGTDRMQFPITPKVSSTFNQKFQSPEWWSTHIWNFETSHESRGYFNDQYYISELNAADLPKNWAAAYGTSTHPHPFAFNNRGYGFGISQYHEGYYFDLSDTVDRVNGFGEIINNWNWTQVVGYGFDNDLSVSVGGAIYTDRNTRDIRGPLWVPESRGTEVEKYGDWTATVNWPYSDGSQLSVTSGHGMPIAQCELSGNDTVNFGYAGTLTIWEQGPNSIGLTMARFNDEEKHYGIFFPTGTTVEGLDVRNMFIMLFGNDSYGWQDTLNGQRVGYDWQASWRNMPDWNNDGIRDSTSLSSAFRIVLPSGTSHFSIAALPDASAGTLAMFQERAFAFVQDSRVEHEYLMNSAEMKIDFNLTTQLVPDAPAGSINETVQALYMHQYKHSPAGNAGETYNSPRGPMQTHYGNSFTVTYAHVGLLPNLGYANTLDSAAAYAELDQIKNMSSLFYDKNPYGHSDPNAASGFYGETYEHGKFLNKYADLLPLCKQVGNEEVFEILIDSLKGNLEEWFDASDALPGGDRYKFFAYDTRVNSLAGYPTGHYAAPNLNDHQLHWGYFVKAAAMIARYDQAWAAEWGPMVEMLIRDANSWMRDDPLFAYMRYFDAYEGHSWISGRAEGRTGLDIESSSESINFATAVALWGANTNQPEIRDWGLFIATTEYKGVEYYWWDKDDDVHGDAYPHRAVGTIWGASSNFELFFYASPLGKYAINWLPITGASMYLGYDTTHMKQLWDEMEAMEFDATRMGWNWDPIANANINPSHRMKGWRTLAAMYRSMWDPEWALEIEEQLDSEYQGWEQNDTTIYGYVKWNDWGAEYDLATGFEGMTPTMFRHYIHTFDSVGSVALVTADWPFTQVFEKDGCKHYMGYNPPGNPARTIAFSDGRSFELPADTLVVWYPLGEPQVTIDADTLVFCSGEELTFEVVDSTDGGEEPTYEWFINGQAVSGVSGPRLTVDSLQGDDSVYVVMTTSLDCYVYETDTSAALKVSENERQVPSIQISSSHTVACTGDSIVVLSTLNAEGNDPKVSWFMDGALLDSSIDSLTLSGSDTTLVWAVLESSEYCVVDSLVHSDTLVLLFDSMSVTELSLSISDTSLCPNDSIRIEALISSSEIYSFEWFRDDMFILGDSEELLLKDLVDLTRVHARINLDSHKCSSGYAYSDTVSIDIQTSGAPFVGIAHSDSVLCPGEEFTALVDTAHLLGHGNYKWLVNKAIIGDDSIFSNPDVEDGDTVQLVASSSLSCLDTNTVYSQAVVVNRLPELTGSLEVLKDETTYCSGDTVVIWSEVLPKDLDPSFFWLLNGEVISGSDSLIRLSDVGSGDVITGGVELSTQCSDLVLLDSVIVSMVTPVIPTIEIAQDLDTVCGDLELQFSAIVSGFADSSDVSWLVNETLVESGLELSGVTLVSGTHTVVAQLNSSLSCLEGVTDRDTLQVVIADFIEWQLPDLLTVEAQESIELPLESNAKSWHWTNPNDLDDVLVERPLFDGLSNTWKFVTMSNEACSAEDSIEIRVLYPFEIPNVFSPNGDGVNDVWNIAGLEAYEGIVIRIYNRWGNLIYNSVGYLSPWDGTHRGREMPTGTYYYVIDGGDLSSLSGFVELMR